MTPTVATGTVVTASQRVQDYVELTKPRVVFMVLVTTLVGFYFGSPSGWQPAVLTHTLLGTALAAGGTLALNQYMERDLDARMHRTRHRPLPDGRLAPLEALLVGAGLLLVGLTYLWLGTNPLCAALTGAIAVVYLLLYTPLKRVSSLCSMVGAVPGALPPVAGWAAACGSVPVDAWILFSIMYLWQIPHTLAISRLFRDDYARADIRVLPVVDWNGPSTGIHSVLNCLALFPIALLPTLRGMAGPWYFGAALLLTFGFLVAAVRFAWGPSLAAARRLMFASLIYLPVLLAVMALDKRGP